MTRNFHYWECSARTYSITCWTYLSTHHSHSPFRHSPIPPFPHSHSQSQVPHKVPIRVFIRIFVRALSRSHSQIQIQIQSHICTCVSAALLTVAMALALQIVIVNENHIFCYCGKMRLLNGFWVKPNKTPHAAGSNRRQKVNIATETTVCPSPTPFPPSHFFTPLSLSLSLWVCVSIMGCSGSPV